MAPLNRTTKEQADPTDEALLEDTTEKSLSAISKDESTRIFNMHDNNLNPNQLLFGSFGVLSRIGGYLIPIRMSALEREMHSISSRLGQVEKERVAQAQLISRLVQLCEELKTKFGQITSGQAQLGRGLRLLQWQIRMGIVRTTKLETNDKQNTRPIFDCLFGCAKSLEIVKQLHQAIIIYASRPYNSAQSFQHVMRLPYIFSALIKGGIASSYQIFPWLVYNGGLLLGCELIMRLTHLSSIIDVVVYMVSSSFLVRSSKIARLQLIAKLVTAIGMVAMIRKRIGAFLLLLHRYGQYLTWSTSC